MTKKLSAQILKRRVDQRAVLAVATEQGMLRERVTVNPHLLRPTNSWSTPDYVTRGYYVDMPFACKTCGKEEAWLATQQKWWYESAQGDVWTKAIRCRPCRRKERERIALARLQRAEGMERQRAKRDGWHARIARMGANYA